MEVIRAKYLGNKSQKATLNRHRFLFNKENNFTCDIPVKLASELFKTGNYTSVPMTIPEQVHNVGIVKEEPIEEVKVKVKEKKKPVSHPKKGAK